MILNHKCYLQQGHTPIDINKTSLPIGNSADGKYSFLIIKLKPPLIWLTLHRIQQNDVLCNNEHAASLKLCCPLNVISFIANCFEENLGNKIPRNNFIMMQNWHICKYKSFIWATSQTCNITNLSLLYRYFYRKWDELHSWVPPVQNFAAKLRYTHLHFLCITDVRKKSTLDLSEPLLWGTTWRMNTSRSTIILTSSGQASVVIYSFYSSLPTTRAFIPITHFVHYNQFNSNDLLWVALKL